MVVFLTTRVVFADIDLSHTEASMRGVFFGRNSFGHKISRQVAEQDRCFAQWGLKGGVNVVVVACDGVGSDRGWDCVQRRHLVAGWW